jgi:hypothetical protein
MALFTLIAPIIVKPFVLLQGIINVYIFCSYMKSIRNSAFHCIRKTKKNVAILLLLTLQIISFTYIFEGRWKVYSVTLACLSIVFMQLFRQREVTHKTLLVYAASLWCIAVAAIRMFIFGILFIAVVLSYKLFVIWLATLHCKIKKWEDFYAMCINYRDADRVNLLFVIFTFWMLPVLHENHEISTTLFMMSLSGLMIIGLVVSEEVLILQGQELGRKIRKRQEMDVNQNEHNN